MPETTVEERIAALEQRVALITDVKAELAHWIGEAKSWERMYRSVDERAMRWFKERGEALAEVETLRAALAERRAEATHA